MTTKIRQGNWSSFSAPVRNSLLKLTFRGPSGLRDAIYEIQEEPEHKHKIFVLFEYNFKAPVAWSLVTWSDWEEGYVLMFYTRRSCRRKGHGRQLYRRARRWAALGGPYTFYSEGPEESNDPNEGFFQAVDPETFEEIYAE